MSAIAADLAEEQRLADDPSMDETIEYGRGTPFTLDDVDDDILSDLAAVGITIRGVKELDNSNTPSHRTEAVAIDAADRSALAATFLRLAGEANADVERLAAAATKQIELVAAHYERLSEPAIARRERFVHLVENIARVAIEAGDFGKKKSASTPWGEFGVTDRKAGVQLADAAALLAYCRQEAPAFVRVVTKLPLDQAREYLSPTELEATKMEAAWGDLKKTLNAEGALPPGVERVDAARVPFAKPSLPLDGRVGGGE